MFAEASSEEARLYNQLKQSRRIQPEFHVTLIHKAAANDNQKIWLRYVDAFTEALDKVDMADKGAPVPILGTVQVKLERLVWDDRVMAFVVRIYPTEPGQNWPSANTITHITVGTASQDVKPKESNDLLTIWESGNREGSRIREKEVPGVKVLDAQIKPVYQRGRGPAG